MTSSKKYPQHEEKPTEDFCVHEPAAAYGASINDPKTEMMQQVMNIKDLKVMKRLLSFTKRLPEEMEQEAEAPCQFTVEELRLEVEEAMDDIRAGNVIRNQQMHETFKRYRL